MKTALLNIFSIIKNIPEIISLMPKWIRTKFFQLHKYINEFGFFVSIIACFKFLNPQYYIKTLEKYFKKFLKDEIDCYLKKTSGDIYKNEIPKEDIDKNVYVWTCWLTGYDSMPDVVKLCYNRMKKMIPPDKAELILITLENYTEYITIPDYIVEKYKKGIIGPAHFSDIIRFCLLSKWGGMWLDSTIYISSPVPEDCLHTFYFSQKAADSSKYALEPSKAMWSSFLWSGTKNNLFFSFVRDGLFHYWKEHNIVIDYVFFDYIMLTGYKQIPAFFEMIEKAEPNNEDIWKLIHIINDKYNSEEYEKLCKDTMFHKLTYKLNLKELTSDNNMTFYGYLIESNKH